MTFFPLFLFFIFLIPFEFYALHPIFSFDIFYSILIMIYATYRCIVMYILTGMVLIYWRRDITRVAYKWIDQWEENDRINNGLTDFLMRSTHFFLLSSSIDADVTAGINSLLLRMHQYQLFDIYPYSQLIGMYTNLKIWHRLLCYY